MSGHKSHYSTKFVSAAPHDMKSQSPALGNLDATVPDHIVSISSATRLFHWNSDSFFHMSHIVQGLYSVPITVILTKL